MENFAITSDLSPIKGLILSTNFEEIKSWLVEQTEVDRKLIVSEDSISQVKKRLAELRKAKTAIDDYRKAAEKEYMKPFEQVKADSKQLIAVIDEAIVNCDSQVKAFENEIKKQKIDGLKEFFAENIGDMAEYLSWERIFNPKWENAGFRVEAAQEEIAQGITKTAQDVELIKSFNSEFEIALLSEYAKSGDFHATMLCKSNFEARKKAQEEREALMRENIPQAEENPVEVEIKPIESKPQQIDTGIRPCVEEPTEKTYTMTLKFTVTMKEAQWLKKTLDDYGISYKKV